MIRDPLGRFLWVVGLGTLLTTWAVLAVGHLWKELELEVDKAQCSGCGAVIVHVRGRNGRAVACEPQLQEVVTERGEICRARVLHAPDCTASAAKPRRPAP